MEARDHAVSVPRPHPQITYADLLRVVHLMHDFPAPWYVSGGWAIDALVGRATRTHEDVEIGIARQDQGYLHRHLATWQLYKVVHNTSRNDADLIPWEPEERLELPVHQIVAQCPGAASPSRPCSSTLAAASWPVQARRRGKTMRLPHHCKVERQGMVILARAGGGEG
ncbi:MAG TPA: hypothetical protein VJY65_06470 [Chloroflexota bacterium]|nr:hypothetical protein [Chloroflexota bacterium]